MPRKRKRPPISERRRTDVFRRRRGKQKETRCQPPRAEEPQISSERHRHRLHVGQRHPLRFRKDHVANELGIPASRLAAKRRKQPHDHATVSTYCQLCDAAMLPQPVLKLEHRPVERRQCELRLALNNPALTEKLDEPAHPPHVLLGHALLATDAGASTAMPSEPIGDVCVPKTLSGFIE